MNLRGEIEPGGFPDYQTTPEEAASELRRLTGQDFGVDADRWEAWFRRHRPRAILWDRLYDDDIGALLIHRRFWRKLARRFRRPGLAPALLAALTCTATLAADACALAWLWRLLRTSKDGLLVAFLTPFGLLACAYLAWSTATLAWTVLNARIRRRNLLRHLRARDAVAP